MHHTCKPFGRRVATLKVQQEAEIMKCLVARLLCPVLLVGCNAREGTPSPPLAAAVSTAAAQDAVAARTQPSRFTEAQVCRATVAVVMGRDPSIIKVERISDGVVRLYYFRPDDGQRWDYRCRLEGQRAVWATAEGRWRTHPQDETIQFVSSGEALTIEQRFTDGSKSIKTFTATQLGS